MTGDITLTLHNVETPEGEHEDMTFTIERSPGPRFSGPLHIARLTNAGSRKGPDGDFTAQTTNTAYLLLLLVQALLKYGPRVAILPPKEESDDVAPAGEAADPLPFIVGMNTVPPWRLRRFATEAEAAAFIDTLEGAKDGRYYIDDMTQTERED